jgi:site-specific recombinase XerD
VNRELACLKALFNFVIKADVLAKNPVSRVKMLAENNLQTRTLSFAEQHLYLVKATPVLRDVATIMLETGMRPEEVYRLRPDNVNLVKDRRGKTATPTDVFCKRSSQQAYDCHEEHVHLSL